MQSLRTSTATVFLIAALVIPVSAHLAVVKTAPADKAGMKSPPERVQVWFTQPPSDRVSRLELHGPGGEVAVGETEVNRTEQWIAAAVKGSLEAGEYEVRWRTAGNDGHVMRGTFRFSLAPSN